MIPLKFVKALPGPVKKPLRLLWGSFSRIIRAPLESLPATPDLFRAYRSLYSHPGLQRQQGGWVYKGKFYPDYLTVGGASGAIFREALKFCEGKGMDVGAGFWPLPGAIAVDLGRGSGMGKTVGDFPEGSVDYVFSSHCLEHIDDWRSALSEWVKKVRHGGIVFLYLPHPECAIWHPGSPFVGEGHKWVPTPERIRLALAELGCEIISCDDGPDAMQSFYVCARKKEN